LRPRRATSGSPKERINFSAKPALDLDDMMQTDGSGRGIVNILAAERRCVVAQGGPVQCAEGITRRERTRALP
jgi:hypothetical protein